MMMKRKYFIFAQLWQINNNLKSSGGGGSLRQHSLNKHCIIKLSTQALKRQYNTYSIKCIHSKMMKKSDCCVKVGDTTV